MMMMMMINQPTKGEKRTKPQTKHGLCFVLANCSKHVRPTLECDPHTLCYSIEKKKRQTIPKPKHQKPIKQTKTKKHRLFFSQKFSNAKSFLVGGETLSPLPPLRAGIVCEWLEFLQTFCILSPELISAVVLLWLKHCFFAVFHHLGPLPLYLSPSA